MNHNELEAKIEELRLTLQDLKNQLEERDTIICNLMETAGYWQCECLKARDRTTGLKRIAFMRCLN